MSLVTDSPVHSSSNDDFTALLDAELDTNSLEASPDEEVEDEESDDEEAEDEEAEDDKVLESNSIKRRKVEMLNSRLAQEESTSQGTPEQETEVPLELNVCQHPGSYGGMCFKCGQKVEDESGVTFGYIRKGLRLGNDEIDRLRNTDMKNLLCRRKLYLILDLDHTLLNTTLLLHLNLEEEYLKSLADSLQDVSKDSLFMLEFMYMMKKLRPFVRTFLKEASEMFDRPYALEMARFLDPGQEYFNAKVISRDDGTQRHQKGLDVVLGQESAVLILDDTENAWTKHKDNLILMQRYHFFASSCRQFGFHCKSRSELKSDESEPDGALASVLKVLKRIHSMFFDELAGDLSGRDVRQNSLHLYSNSNGKIYIHQDHWHSSHLALQVLKTVRKEVLKGYKLVFSRVFPTRFPADNHHFRKIAEQLGATCLTEVDPSATHVVSTDARTEKSRWAVKEKKFLVNPQWIESANFLWQKQPEENFPVKQTKDQ